MPRTREAILTRLFLDEVRKQYPGVFIYKINERVRAGVPDAVCIWRGQHVWLEFKVHPNRTTKLQDRTITEIRQTGAQVGVVTFGDGGCWWQGTGGIDVYATPLTEFVAGLF